MKIETILVSIFLFIPILPSYAGDSDWDLVNIYTATYPSSAQIRYLQSYGNPDQFLLLYVMHETDSQGRIGKLDTPRRIESWIYAKLGLRVIFDNGFFTKEVEIDPGGAIEGLPSTDLKPTEFSSTTTFQTIETRFGKPDKIETSLLGPLRFDIYRYLSSPGGAKSFTFLNGQLVGVAAGFVFVPNEDFQSKLLEEEKNEGVH